MKASTSQGQFQVAQMGLVVAECLQEGSSQMDRIRISFQVLWIRMRRFLSRQDKVFSHPVILAAFVAGFISLMQLQVLMGLETWRLDRQLEVEGHANRASLLQDYFDDMERIVPGERGLLGLDPDPALAALANARTRVAFREQEESDYGREIILNSSMTWAL
jgi:hypothetical protein